jgi:RNA polymerase sigma-70 factor (ECF subfamily)
MSDKSSTLTGLPAATSFEAHRRYLTRVAYAITGSVAEAEDCVQDAWLRLHRAPDIESIRDVRSWLAKTVTRLALDVLRSARRRHEDYVGVWLPEPLVEIAGATDPDTDADLGASVSLALMVVLERLSLLERTAFLLHDVFELPFDEVGEKLGRSAEAVRQAASRARVHVRAAAPRFPVSRSEQKRLVEAFVTACQAGDVNALLQILHPDAVWEADHGGKVRAAFAFLRGAEKIAQAATAMANGPWKGLRSVDVNGAPGVVMRDPGGVTNVVSFGLDGGRITSILVIRNPEKLVNLAWLEVDAPKIP